MFKYKIDIMKELANVGFTANRLRKGKIISESTMQRLREGKPVSLEVLNTVCIILERQLSDIVTIIPTQEELDNINKSV